MQYYEKSKDGARGYIIQSHWVEKNGHVVTPVISNWRILQESCYYSDYYTHWNEGFVIVNNEILFRSKDQSDYDHLQHKYYRLTESSGNYTREGYQQFLTQLVDLTHKNFNKEQYMPVNDLLGFDNHRRVPKTWNWDATKKVLTISLSDKT